MLAAAAVVLATPAAAPATGLETVLQDDAQLLHRPEPQLRQSLENLRQIGVDRLRVTAGWSVLTRDADSRKKPAFDATDPRAYEQERWRNLDRLLILAREYGFSTMVDIAFWAPHWAASDPIGERGRTDVNVQEYAKFAVAVARRYSGNFKLRHAVPASARGPLYQPSRDEQYLSENFGTVNVDSPTAGLPEVLRTPFQLPARDEDPVAAALGTETSPPKAALPKVDVFTIWNEPNHSGFLRPQWRRAGRNYIPSSPHAYRDMVLASYPALKAVRPDSTVLVGGTAAYGSYANEGVGNVPPLRFLRELACVDRRLRPIKRSGCDRFAPIPGDGWSHHPYTMLTEPDAHARPGRVDDVPLADMPKLYRLIDRLVRRGRVAPGNRNLWITEYGYETNPPLPDHKYTVGDQARFLPWAESIASRQPGVRTFAQFLLRDLPPGAFRVGKSKKRAFGQWHSGLFEDDGDAKLGVFSFKTGLFVRQNRRGQLRIFGRLRLNSDSPRTLRVERAPRRRPRSWRPIPTRAAPGGPPAAEFTVGGRDAFVRHGFGTRSLQWRYRLSERIGSQWMATGAVPVRPVRRP